MDTEHYRHKDEMASKTILWQASEETHGRHETGRTAATSIKVLLKERCRLQWLRGRASDSRLRGPRFESCAAVLKPWAILFTLQTVVDICTSSLHTVIVAYGWMVPREVEMVSD